METAVSETVHYKDFCSFRQFEWRVMAVVSEKILQGNWGTLSWIH
jgi:hypothetical protein